jgi:hypothetical protein
VRRPQALDRRLAALFFSVGAIALLVTVSVSAAPSLPRPEPDAAAMRDLVALMRAGERGRWLVTYDFTRELADGRSFSEVMREGRTPALHVLMAGTSMRIESPHRAYDCTLLEAHAGCTASDSAQVLPESEVLRVAVNTGVYGVSRLPGRTFAGEHARCFRVLPTGPGVLPDIGDETDVCLADDGVALEERIARTTGSTDERVATAVERNVSTDRVKALARSFDPGASEPPR